MCQALRVEVDLQSCCAELPCWWGSACPPLPCHCPSKDTEGLVLTLLSDPLLHPCSCSVPSLCLCAIAPRLLLLMGMEAAGGGDLHPW